MISFHLLQGPFQLSGLRFSSFSYTTLARLTVTKPHDFRVGAIILSQLLNDLKNQYPLIT